VVSVVDQLPDAVPSRDAKHPAGNAVVLDHGQNEFSVLAHLRKGSVGVKPGQSVRLGQLIGLCGSSGNASEPRPHVQAMNGPELFAAESVPMPFSEVVVTAQAHDTRGNRPRANSKPRPP
jgi:murein DD-endopeptidase MepM/ murein hydrolase activator NlpD